MLAGERFQFQRRLTFESISASRRSGIESDEQLVNSPPLRKHAIVTSFSQPWTLYRWREEAANQGGRQRSARSRFASRPGKPGETAAEGEPARLNTNFRVRESSAMRHL